MALCSRRSSPGLRKALPRNDRDRPALLTANRHSFLLSVSCHSYSSLFSLWEKRRLYTVACRQSLLCAWPCTGFSLLTRSQSHRRFLTLCNSLRTGHAMSSGSLLTEVAAFSRPAGSPDVIAMITVAHGGAAPREPQTEQGQLLSLQEQNAREATGCGFQCCRHSAHSNSLSPACNIRGIFLQLSFCQIIELLHWHFTFPHSAAMI